MQDLLQDSNVMMSWKMRETVMKLQKNAWNWHQISRNFWILMFMQLIYTTGFFFQNPVFNEKTNIVNL